MDISIENYNEKLTKFKYILLDEYTEDYQIKKLKQLKTFSTMFISKNFSVKKKLISQRKKIKKSTQAQNGKIPKDQHQEETYEKFQKAQQKSETRIFLLI